MSSEVFSKHGAVSWTELNTRDPEAAKKFYGTLFGWTYEKAPNAEMPYDVIQSAVGMIGGIFKTPQDCDDGGGPHWMSYVTVSNVDDTAKMAAELGGKILMGPQDIPKVGRFCIIQDPQGAPIAAITYSMK